MLSAVAYIDTEEGAFGSWLESFTESTLPRPCSAPGGRQGLIQPAKNLNHPYATILEIEVAFPSESEPSDFGTTPHLERACMRFHVSYASKDRVAVWIDCEPDFLKGYCWELLGEIRTCWPKADVRVLRPTDAVPPSTADPQLVTLNAQLISDLTEEWGKQLLQRRLRVASMVHSGMTARKIAETLGVGTRTIERDRHELKGVHLLN